MTALTALLFHGAVDVPFCFPRRHIGSLVIELFAFAHTKLQLYFTTFEIKLQGDQCISLQLLLLLQVFDLPFMHQQLAFTHRVPVKNVAFLIWADVHAQNIQLTAIDLHP